MYYVVYFVLRKQYNTSSSILQYVAVKNVCSIIHCSTCQDAIRTSMNLDISYRYDTYVPVIGIGCIDFPWRLL